MARTSRAERVLIIDDDILSREVLTFLLEDAAHSVTCVPSGEAALEHLGEPLRPPPTVVLTDVQLPGLAGQELSNALRRVCSPGAVLLAMSGSHPPPQTLAAFDGFLLKPFQPQQFADIVEHCRFGEEEPEPVPDPIQEYPESTTESHQSRTADKGPPASKLQMNASLLRGPQSEPSVSGSASPASVPALDERIFTQLGDTMSGTQLRQMYELCIDDVRKRIATMRGHAAAQEPEPFVRQAHAIKGGCGMLGASELYKMAARLERSGLEAAGLTTVSAVNPLDELMAACDRLERILITRT